MAKFKALADDVVVGETTYKTGDVFNAEESEVSALVEAGTVEAVVDEA